jgi:hypothetical protein
MNDSIHVQVEIVKLDIIGVRLAGVHRNSHSIDFFGLKLNNKHVNEVRRGLKLLFLVPEKLVEFVHSVLTRLSFILKERMLVIERS